MKKSQLASMPQFFDRYINLVEDVDLIEALEKYARLSNDEERQVLERIGDKSYAEGKWTAKEVIQHIIDNERIQAYRALRFARNDKTNLPGYDENYLAQSAKTGHLEMSRLIREFELVRQSNILMYKGFGDVELLRKGICFNTDISVLALGFVLVGHQIHHMSVLKERYWNL